MELKRDIYMDLLAWKKRNSGHVLEVRGARQVGKTYILNKFAKENYAHYFYINMTHTSGQDFLMCLDKATEWKPGMARNERPIHEALTLFDRTFQDTEDTIVVIDEIQESAKVFSLVRQFAREFSCHFVITGSYLGKALDKGYFQPVGDLDILTMHPLSFSEFVRAVGEGEMYEQADLFGESNHEIYDRLKGVYEAYCLIGGYPSVVTTYIESGSYEAAQQELERIIRVFIDETEYHFNSVLEQSLFERIFPAIASMMIREKKGSKDLTTELSSIIYQEESSQMTKKNINTAVAWLYQSRVIGFCGKVREGNMTDFTMDNRFYFMDVGVCRRFLNAANADEATLRGIINENFVYINLMKRVEQMEIGGVEPMFGTYKDGEIDFMLSNRSNYKTYGIEVKAGRGAGKTSQELLRDHKVEAVYYLKGDTYGGREGRMLTVPIYLVDRVRFDYIG